ncbi:MAG: hypothetical protein AB8F95_06640 [Bacteroidia bacterium]
MIERKTIEFETAPRSLNWKDGQLIDWVGGGNLYSLNGDFRDSQRRYAYKFDSVIQSEDGVYSIIYEKLGTKAIVLKKGELIRELNISYYQAGAYEFPIQFIKLQNDKYGILYCPNEYNLLEIEDAETGEKITQTHDRNPDDCFHSRLRVNPSNTVLLNTGWIWHPYGIIELYEIGEGIKDNSIFDKITLDFPTKAEICSAEFLDDDLVMVSSTSENPIFDNELADSVNLLPGQIGLYSISEKRFLKKNFVDFKLGTLIPINQHQALDLYEHPKLIDLDSGQAKIRFEDINSGKQNSAIIHHLDHIPPIAVDMKHKRIAIGNGNKIELLTF